MNGKTVVLCVGPVLGRELMPAIERAGQDIEAVLKIDQAARNTAWAAVMASHAVKAMEHIPTAALASRLNNAVTRRTIAAVLDDPEVFISDKNTWWPAPWRES